MKLSIIVSMMILGISLDAGAARTVGDEAITEATSASQAYDPTKEDCKCQGPMKAERPLDNEANDKRVVNWISDPSTPGAAPSYTAEPETTN